LQEQTPATAPIVTGVLQPPVYDGISFVAGGCNTPATKEIQLLHFCLRYSLLDIRYSHVIPTFNHHLIIPTMISFWILWIFNALMSLIPIYFFFIGLADGSVDSDNMGIWMILLAVVALIMGGTYWLKTKNQIKAAKVVLIIAAIPSILAIIFMSVAIFGDVRWN